MRHALSGSWPVGLVEHEVGEPLLERRIAGELLIELALVDHHVGDEPLEVSIMFEWRATFTLDSLEVR